MVDPERRVQSKVPWGCFSVSPRFCLFFIGAYQRWQLFGSCCFLFHNPNMINLSIPFLLQKWKQQTPVVSITEASLFIKRTFLTPKLSPFLLHSLFCIWMHAAITPRHKSLVLGSDGEGCTSMSQDHWIRVEMNGWIQRKQPGGSREVHRETEDTGTDRA